MTKKSKNPKMIQIVVSGCEGDLKSGTGEKCPVCKKMLGGLVFLMMVAYGGSEPRPQKMFCSKGCYFVDFEKIDQAMLATGAEWVYEIGGRD